MTEDPNTQPIDEELEAEGITDAERETILDQRVINPMTNLIVSMKEQDETCRKVMAGFKRLFIQTKGHGTANLTEIMQICAALYSLSNLSHNQNLLVTNTCTSDLDTQRWHLRALQELLVENLAYTKMGSEDRTEEQAEERLGEVKEELRDRINELFRVEQEKTRVRRAKAIEEHKDSILDAAISSMDRPDLKKEEPKKDEDVDKEAEVESSIILP